MVEPKERRINAQLWDCVSLKGGEWTAMDNAVLAAVKVARGNESMRPHDMVLKTDELLGCLNTVEASASFGAAQAMSAVADLAVLQRRIEDNAAAAGQCRGDIARLEAELAGERVAKDRRMQYDAIAEIILREPARAASEKIVADETAACAALEAEERALHEAQVNVHKNFQLVMQSCGDLDAYAQSDAFSGKPDPDAGQVAGGRPPTAAAADGRGDVAVMDTS
jgi:hypothetical protein